VESAIDLLDHAFNNVGGVIDLLDHAFNIVGGVIDLPGELSTLLVTCRTWAGRLAARGRNPHPGVRRMIRC
jgi:hypothetical protein